jgi:hypothetical protein
VELSQVKDVLSTIKGCTFASVDTITRPSAGLRKEVTGTMVILFTNKKTRSGYENMVRRRLADAGLDPSTFEVDQLPWGSRVPNTPLIVHKDAYYLQCIVMKEGKAEYFVGDHKVPRESITWLREPSSPNQGLANDRQVRISTYKLESIKQIRVMGETITAAAEGGTRTCECLVMR